MNVSLLALSCLAALRAVDGGAAAAAAFALAPSSSPWSGRAASRVVVPPALGAGRNMNDFAQGNARSRRAGGGSYRDDEYYDGRGRDIDRLGYGYRGDAYYGEGRGRDDDRRLGYGYRGDNYYGGGRGRGYGYDEDPYDEGGLFGNSEYYDRPGYSGGSSSEDFRLSSYRRDGMRNLDGDRGRGRIPMIQEYSTPGERERRNRGVRYGWQQQYDWGRGNVREGSSRDFRQGSARARIQDYLTPGQRERRQQARDGVRYGWQQQYDWGRGNVRRSGSSEYFRRGRERDDVQDFRSPRERERRQREDNRVLSRETFGRRYGGGGGDGGDDGAYAERGGWEDDGGATYRGDRRESFGRRGGGGFEGRDDDDRRDGYARDGLARESFGRRDERSPMDGRESFGQRSGGGFEGRDDYDGPDSPGRGSFDTRSRMDGE